MSNLNFGAFQMPTMGVATVNNNAAVAEAPAAVDLDHFEDWNLHKVQDITLDQLKQTSRELGGNGAPNNGILHYAFINRVLDMCKEHNFNAEIRDLFACKQGSSQWPGVSVVDNIAKRINEPELMQQRNIHATIVRRVFCNITIRDFDDNSEYTNALTLSYSQRGIQAAVGQHVWACHNMTILGADQTISTFNDGTFESSNKYTRVKYTFEDVLARIEDWLSHMDSIAHSGSEKIRKMKETVIPANVMYGLFGFLSAYRVQCDSKNDSIRIKETYPLNNSQLNQFIESCLIKAKQNEYASPDHTGFITAWDFYNAATDTHKAHQMDSVQVVPQNIALMNFMDKFVLGM